MLLLVQTNVVLWIFQLLILLLGCLFGYGNNDIQASTYCLIINYFLSFFIVNKYSYNQLNIPNFFLLGVGFLLLGKIFAWILDSRIGTFRSLFCLDFFFTYCMEDNQIVSLVTFLNTTLLFFNFGFLIKFKRKFNSIYYDKALDPKYKLLMPIMIFIGIYLIYNTFFLVLTTVNNGYMALFASQAEAYEPPTAAILRSLLLGYIALLYAFKDKYRTNKLFIILFSLFIGAMYLRILTGSRSYTISATILLIWVIFSSKKITTFGYTLFLCLGLILMGSLNVIAQTSGARELETGDDFLTSLSALFYSQGSSLLVLNTSITFEGNPSFLGLLKTLLPGIQVIYGFFDIRDRYLFDWSSNIIYFKDKELYNQGYGLGWSVFSDLYYIAYKNIIFYFVLVMLLGVLINYIITQRKVYYKGLSFIFVYHIFSLPRDNISPLIFSCMMYSLIFFYFTKKKVNI